MKARFRGRTEGEVGRGGAIDRTMRHCHLQNASNGGRHRRFFPSRSPSGIDGTPDVTARDLVGRTPAGSLPAADFHESAPGITGGPDAAP